jgi:hypothetical protein
MAITKVPQIRGYTIPNSVPYGLSLTSNFSSAPSKLTVSFVNADGNYSLPSLNLSSTYRITFGGFTFQGKLWGYNLKESASEKTLEVEFIDNSVILDQYYVVLWKRGFFGEKGTPVSNKIEVDLSKETYLVPTFSKGSFPYTSYVEKSLKNQVVYRNSREFRGATVGNIILVGKENLVNSECDIPDTFYTFNDLRKLLPFTPANAPSDSNLKGTNEGTLRSVLNSWCGDLGYDYFWNYSTNRLEFYSVSQGIRLSPPSFNAGSIISKEKSASLQGTFRQYGASYTAKPKEALKTVGFSSSFSTSRSVNPIHLSFLINKNDRPQNLDDTKDDKSTWGSKRSQNEFLACAFLGYISRNLRDIYCLQKEYDEVLGYQANTKYIQGQEKQKLISFLTANGFEDAINEFKKLDNDTLENYDFIFTPFDEEFANSWFQIEQDMLQSLGKYYRIPDSSGSFFFCSKNIVAEINITIEPEGANELIGGEKNGVVRKVLTRGGQMSHSAEQILDQLAYKEISQNISQCLPYHAALRENGLLEKLALEDFNLEKNVTHLVIIPNYDNFVKKICPVDIKITNAGNPQEVTSLDMQKSNSSTGRKNCPNFDENLKNTCLTAREEAKDMALKDLGSKEDKDRDSLVSGLVNRLSKKASIKLKGAEASLCAPSDSPFKIVCSYSINANKISNTTNNEIISFKTTAPSSRRVDMAEIRFVLQNETDATDEYATTRKKFIPLPKVESTAPQRTEKYVIAGEPNGSLRPSDGLTSIDVSLSSEGFTTSLTYSSRPPSLVRADNTLRQVNSQLNRVTFNAS